MSKRKRTSTEELPLLEIVFRPGDTRPVICALAANFPASAETNISVGTTNDLAELCRAMDFLRNAIADELVYRMKHPLEFGYMDGKFPDRHIDDIPF